MNDVIPNACDHLFRHGSLEDEGSDESRQAVAHGLIDHHGPDPVAQLSKAMTIEAKDWLQHVCKQMSVEQLVPRPQTHQFSGDCQLADAWETMYDV